MLGVDFDVHYQLDKKWAGLRTYILKLTDPDSEAQKIILLSQKQIFLNIWYSLRHVVVETLSNSSKTDNTFTRDLDFFLISDMLMFQNSSLLKLIPVFYASAELKLTCSFHNESLFILEWDVEQENQNISLL